MQAQDSTCGVAYRIVIVVTHGTNSTLAQCVILNGLSAGCKATPAMWRSALLQETGLQRFVQGRAAAMPVLLQHEGFVFQVIELFVQQMQPEQQGDEGGTTEAVAIPACAQPECEDREQEVGDGE